MGATGLAATPADPALQLSRDGYVVRRVWVGAAQCATLAAALPTAPPRAGGIRNALDPERQPAAALVDQRMNALATELLGRPACAVRAIVFDKTPASNWAVGWHQDLAIPVRQRHDLPRYRGWSRKQGVWHVQPPESVLEDMLTLRLHLDDCGGANGPLKVLPGSHRLGRVEATRIAALVGEGDSVECTASAGDVLAMRPLLLHASGKAVLPGRRRVLHVEYSAVELPAPPRWPSAFLR
jgi:ectoine hydroxylase-related dioxygenase (phytanoyl-CoA dioxygenase family)